MSAIDATKNVIQSKTFHQIGKAVFVSLVATVSGLVAAKNFDEAFPVKIEELTKS